MARNKQPGSRDRAVQEALAALRQASPGISTALDALAEQVQASLAASPASPVTLVPPASPVPLASSAGKDPSAAAGAGLDEGTGTEGAELCDSPDGHPAHTVKKPQGEIAPPVEARRTARGAAFSREELVRSVVMAEVLGKPVALRRGGKIL